MNEVLGMSHKNCLRSFLRIASFLAIFSTLLVSPRIAPCWALEESDTDESSSGITVHAIPTEVTEYAFSFLTREELGRMSLVCRRWKKISEHDFLWRVLQEKSRSILVPTFKKEHIVTISTDYEKELKVSRVIQYHGLKGYWEGEGISCTPDEDLVPITEIETLTPEGSAPGRHWYPVLGRLSLRDSNGSLHTKEVMLKSIEIEGLRPELSFEEADSLLQKYKKNMERLYNSKWENVFTNINGRVWKVTGRSVYAHPQNISRCTVKSVSELGVLWYHEGKTLLSYEYKCYLSGEYDVTGFSLETEVNVCDLLYYNRLPAAKVPVKEEKIFD